MCNVSKTCTMIKRCKVSNWGKAGKLGNTIKPLTTSKMINTSKMSKRSKGSRVGNASNTIKRNETSKTSMMSKTTKLFTMATLTKNLQAQPQLRRLRMAPSFMAPTKLQEYLVVIQMRISLLLGPCATRSPPGYGPRPYCAAHKLLRRLER